MTKQVRVEATGHTTRGGGNILIYGAEFPVHWESRVDSVVLGALELRPWHNSEIEIDELAYRDETNDSLFGMLFAGSAAGAHSSETDAETDEADARAPAVTPTRRSILAAVAAAGSVGALSSTAAASDLEQSTVAEFRLESNPQGVQIGVVDALDNHLPADQTYYVEVDGTSRGSFEPGSGQRLTLNPGIEGDVTVKASDAVGTLSGMFASWFAEDTVEFSGVEPQGLADEEHFTDRAGDRVVLNDHLLADAVADAGASDTEILVDGTTIPHADDDAGNELGYWHLQGTQLLYTVGQSPPEARLFDARIGESGFSFL